MEDKRIAVFFPGIGYTNDKPLLYYTRKLYANAGYEIKLVEYDGFPAGVFDNKEKIKESVDIALRQAEAILDNTDFDLYNEVVFVGKSIGTAVASCYGSKVLHNDRIKYVFLTPLDISFENAISNCVVFTGDNDPWVGKENSIIPIICKEKDIPCHIYKGCNHSLESGNMSKDIKVLENVTDTIKEYT